MELRNKVVVITGGTKGLGKTLAISFLKENAKVAVCGRNEDEFKDLPDGILGVKADVTKENEVKDLAEKVIEKFGKIDIWVNNAGVLYRFTKEEPTDMQKFHQMFDVNLLGTVFGCYAALDNMEHSENSVIINILSRAGIDATRALKNKLYAASKWAARGYLQAFQFENADSKIKFISVYPGGIKTDLWRGYEVKNLGQFMEPEFVADEIIKNLKKDKPEEELIVKRPE
jgi:NAD(P)-dependent dehydrogenase (short-subunit alcohol dehydrogenase family)